MKSLKKFTTIIALVLAFAMLLGACGTASGKKGSRRDDDEEEEEEEEETTEEETEDTEPTTEDTEETEEPVNTEEVLTPPETKAPEGPTSEISYYGDIMDNIMYLASGNANEDDVWEMMGVCEFVMYNDYETAHKDLGYILKDVNGDDIPELMIVDRIHFEFDDSEDAFRVLALYTRSEKYLPTLVFEGWTRNEMILLNDGSFFNIGSGGAAYTTMQVFRVNNETTTDTLWSCFTDFEDPEDYNSELCWYTSDNGEIELLGTVEEYSPDIPDAEEYYDISKDFVPLSDNEHRYEIVMCDCTYDEAVQKCEEMGGHLATFDSEREALTIASVITYNTEYVSLFVGEPTQPEGYEDFGGNGDCYMAGISGQDGSMYVQHVSEDPVGSEPSMTGFMGFICEYEYK